MSVLENSNVTDHVCLQEVDRSWREYDKLSADVTLAKSDLLEELEALGSPQVCEDTHTNTVHFLHRHISRK